MVFTLGFEDDGAVDQALVGGKSANLGRLLQAGFQVPPGFTVTTEAYHRAIADGSLAGPIGDLLVGVDYDDVESLETTTAKIRELIVSAPLPDEVVTETLTAYHALGENLFVAVRSSGTAEDLAETSFAGQHDTYLDIRGDDELLDAVRRCWASMWTGRATAYRQQHGISHDTVGLAVAVQTMISAEVSGVMFTANPLTAATDEVVINASYGLGEGIVSGILVPDQFVVAHRGLRVKHSELGSKEVSVVRDANAGHGVATVPTPDTDRGRLCLDETQLRKLGRLAKGVQKYYEGIPQDIEWAIADGELYLLQSRDITGVEFCWYEDLEGPNPPEVPDGTLWTRKWSDWGMPGPVSPLFYSVRAEEVYKLHRNEYELWGAPDIAELPMWKYYSARPYYNTEIDRRLFPRFLPPQLRAPELLVLLPEGEHQAVLEAKGWSLKTVLTALARIRLLRPEHGPLACWKNFEARMKRADEALGLGPEELAELDDDELKEYLKSRLEAARDWFEDVWTALFLWMPFFFGALIKMVEHWYDGDNKAIVTDLITGLPRRPATLEENIALWRLAEQIRHSDELRALFDEHEGAAFFTALEGTEEGRAFLANYQAFVREYGHRGHSERDFIFDRRVENPAIDYVSFKTLITAESDSPDATFDELIAKREAAQADMEASIRKQPLAALKIEAFRFTVDWMLKIFLLRDDERNHSDRYTMGKKRALLEIAKRLQQRGVIEGDEFWFLSLTELLALLDGAPRTRLVDLKITARRRSYERVEQGYVPPMYVRDGHPVDLDVPLDVEAIDGVLSGKPMSVGEITGTARIVRKQSEIGRVQKGDILVCDSTDPGWTPVFYAISGVVVQTGGMLSHAACISREYGLPAVQLPGAMGLIPDGATISVNGDTGKVTIEAESEAVSEPVAAAS